MYVVRYLIHTAEVNDMTTYLVVLVDRKKTIMFMLVNGISVERSEEFVKKDVPQNVRANEEKFYGRSDKIFRHIEDHLHRHLQQTAEVIVDFVGKEKISGVVLGGHEYMFQKVSKHLPVSLRKKIKGTFITELNAPFNNILEKTKQTITAFEQDTSFIFA